MNQITNVYDVRAAVSAMKQTFKWSENRLTAPSQMNFKVCSLKQAFVM